MPEFICNHTPTNVDEFTKGYLECAEWLACSDNEYGEMTEEDREECQGFTKEAIDSAVADCECFQEANEEALSRYYDLGRDQAHAGHDFYLSRNGHGAGFFDRGNDPVYRVLQNAARLCSSSDCTYYEGFLHLD